MSRPATVVGLRRANGGSLSEHLRPEEEPILEPDEPARASPDEPEDVERDEADEQAPE
jgi:hypothetical protein